MTDINRVTLQGRLGADPELRYTPRGTPVVSFRLATSKKVQEEDVTTWHRVVGFATRAQEWADLFKRGDCVRVEGEISTRSFTDRHGQKKYVTEVTAHSMQKVSQMPKQSNDLRAKAAGDTSFQDDEMPY